MISWGVFLVGRNSQGGVGGQRCNAQAIVPVNEIITDMTNAGFHEWTPEAVSESHRWDVLRRAAKKALDGWERADS